jgi:16S rRNA processing protein RimM
MSGLDWASMVVVGRVVRPHGRRGEVVVEAETDFAAERFSPGETLHWRRGDDVEPARVSSSRPYDARWVIGFEGSGSIDEAEALRGLELRIPAGALRTLQPGAYYTHDLVGCRVETAAGQTVGDVTGVQFGSGAPLLVVGGAGGDVLVPMAEAICRTIDVAARRIVIDPPAGLLELNRRSDDA